MFIVQPTPIMITGVIYGGGTPTPTFIFYWIEKGSKEGRRSITHSHMIVIQKPSEWRTFGIEDLRRAVLRADTK
jgi:hypothetical protein